MKKIHMLYREDKDGKEIIEAFTTNEYVAELFVDIYHDIDRLGIDTHDMYDEDYEKFVEENGGKEIIKLGPANNTLMGLLLIRKCDKPKFMKMHIGSR
jgi:hypothetical protein